MYRSVVVALSWDDDAKVAVGHGAALARLTGAAIELVTVKPTYVDVGDARRHLAAVAAAHGLDATLRLVTAPDPAAGLAEIGSEPGTLLCLQTHARRPLAELALGSVSAQVVRSCRRPVLLLGPRCAPAGSTYEAMVVALDTSALAETILPVATEWCTHLGLTPWLFQVLPALVPFEEGSSDIDEAAYLHNVANQLGRDGLKAEWDTAHDRDAATAIARFADEHRPAIVALSTHGRSGLGQLAMGSVALAVAHRSISPVLVRRPHDLPEE
jgi:nucleotide-binding universal stress UspA family protein